MSSDDIQSAQLQVAHLESYINNISNQLTESMLRWRTKEVAVPMSCSLKKAISIRCSLAHPILMDVGKQRRIVFIHDQVKYRIIIHNVPAAAGLSKAGFGLIQDDHHRCTINIPLFIPTNSTTDQNRLTSNDPVYIANEVIIDTPPAGFQDIELFGVHVMKPLVQHWQTEMTKMLASELDHASNQIHNLNRFIKLASDKIETARRQRQEEENNIKEIQIYQ